MWRQNDSLGLKEPLKGQYGSNELLFFEMSVHKKTPEIKCSGVENDELDF